MRMIDADALKREWHMGEKCEECEQDARQCQHNVDFSRMDICSMLDDAPTVGGWISVKDRLPDKPCGCLVFNIYGWRALDFWVVDGWAISDENEITHWMPLPPGPVEVINADKG